MKKVLLTTAGALFACTSFAADCGKVTIAEMNWNSASLMANVDRFILEHGYDCDAELVPGDTMPTGASMIEKEEPDIAPEFWTNSMKEALDRGVEEGRLKIASKSLSDGGEEGFWVPKYMVEEYPELATIEGVLEHADLFTHPEDPSVSGFYGCPAGWNCQITAGNLFQALQMDDAGFELIDPGSGAGLSGSIARAYERQAPWIGYYWAPTAILGKYEMVKVDFGSGVDEEQFRQCITSESCLDPQVTMYPPSPVYTMTTAQFADRAPQAFEYMQSRSFTNAQMNGLLAWMEENQADGQYAAENFMFEHEDIWSQWVSADVKQKIVSALDEL
ncbi:Substrate binding domain of ABC-type glycine betaine transport system [Marinomonas aquimarina]|uniref:Substrate binding domain of ABC-type glycine betaine transport system n=1 Tax=Marinomonas aquimarina TaxID=295068 RepID=A0A1A8T6X8_9GAMM|nr:ABC transporter substrate-binding protein [Marinomonas aquimarina]SBS27079.1 Substrate binding domain of ABC-type glycine betaine transport system [Marinomonas aquimarina]